MIEFTYFCHNSVREAENFPSRLLCVHVCPFSLALADRLARDSPLVWRVVHTFHNSHTRPAGATGRENWEREKTTYKRRASLSAQTGNLNAIKFITGRRVSRDLSRCVLFFCLAIPKKKLSFACLQQKKRRFSEFFSPFHSCGFLWLTLCVDSFAFCSHDVQILSLARSLGRSI